MIAYSVGDVIEYRVGHELRQVRARDKEPEDGVPAFEGEWLNGPAWFTYNGGGVWGYDSQIVRVVERARSEGGSDGTEG